MKKIFILVFSLLLSVSLFAQKKQIKKIEKKGDLFEATIYYKNGNLMQHGFFTKKGKLQGPWESYYIDGRKKCLATYDYGKKVGVWTYFYDKQTKKVTYIKDKIVKIEKIDEGEK
ncbi:MAG: toxin-antitoxin system YwqK family antitoxin [Lutibacter sp.]